MSVASHPSLPSGSARVDDSRAARAVPAGPADPWTV